MDVGQALTWRYILQAFDWVSVSGAEEFYQANYESYASM